MARQQAVGVADRLRAVDSFEKYDPAVERAAIELRSCPLNSLEKVSERLQHLAVPNAGLAFPSATQTRHVLDSWEMSLLTPRGSVVVKKQTLGILR